MLNLSSVELVKRTADGKQEKSRDSGPDSLSEGNSSSSNLCLETAKKEVCQESREQ